MSDERRRFRRHDVLAQVRVKRGQVTYILDVVNLSCSGAFVSTGVLKDPQWASPGTKVDLDLFAPSRKELISLAGTIMHVHRTPAGVVDGFGVHFRLSSEAARSTLERFVQRAVQHARSGA